MKRSREQLIKELDSLTPGHYVCIREVDRENFSAPKTNEKSKFVFYKDENDIYPFMIIGSDGIFSSQDMLENSYGEYTPLENIRPI